MKHRTVVLSALILATAQRSLLAADGLRGSWARGAPALRCLRVVSVGTAVALSVSLAAPAAAGGDPAVGAANATPGAVWAWGDEDIFGNGSTALVRGPGLSDVLSVAVSQGGGGNQGAEGTGYALREDGTVWAWGGGASGELGSGTPPKSGETAVPVPVHGLSDVVAIAGASDGAYAVRRNGTVWAWGGDDQTGLLGNGTKEGSSDVPVQVRGLSGAVAVAGGSGDGYAVLAGGTVWAWGVGGDGQLGDGSRAALSDVPVRVHGLAGAISVAGSDLDGYAVLADGTIWAWGDNSSGQLGDGTHAPGSDVPVQVKGLSDMVAVAAFPGSDSIIALRRDGTVWHWGAAANAYSTAFNDIPVQVHGLRGAVTIAAGYDTEFALLGNGTVWGWGDDEDGEMGNGVHQGAFAVPLMVRGLRGVVAIAGGVAEELAVVGPKS